MKRLYLLVVCIVCVGGCPSFTVAQEPYYGFYPSAISEEYLLFRHNIYGFQIEMPVNWTFGVVGAPPYREVMLYPAGREPNLYRERFQSVSIGVLGDDSSDLMAAARETIVRLKRAHEQFEMVREPALVREGVCTYQFSWETDGGKLIMEDTHLYAQGERVLSVTARVVGRDAALDMSTFTPLLDSFEPIPPVYE